MEKSLWIEKGNPLYECPYCHETFDKPWNYCPDCGKKMIFNEKDYLRKQLHGFDIGTYDKILSEKSYIPPCCINCPNHPTNGGSGICNCAAPYITNTAVPEGTNYQNLDFFKEV